jgi:hypothetical protein
MSKKFITNSYRFTLLALFLIAALLVSLLQPYTVLADPGWTTQTVDSSTDAAFTSIALDSNGYPHIAYTSGGTHRLRYTRWNGTSWDAYTVVDSTSGDLGWFTSIAVDSNDHPHISYYDNTNSSLKYAYYDGTTWHTETVDNAGRCGEFGTSIALDSSDHPHISYLIRSGLVDLRYIKHNGTSWDTPITVDSTDWVGYYSSLALDSSDYPHISYIYKGVAVDDDNGKLKYARWTGSTWDLQTLYDINTSALEWPGYNKHTSIALDSSSYPHISFWKPSGLWYASYNGTTWSEEKVSGSGKYNNLALDSNNYPHINFLSGDEKSLKYARFDGASWSVETVQSHTTNMIGEFSDIALDRYDYPHISYNGSNRLRYARYTGPPVITTVNPAQGNQGQTFTVTLTGYSFTGATTISFGNGITVNNFSVDSDTQTTVNISIANNAAPGTRNVSATTPEGTGTKNNGFTVNQPPSQNQSSESPALPEQLITTPPRILVTNVNSQPRSSLPNQSVVIYANVVNRGDSRGSYTVDLKINGQVEETRTGNLGGHAALPLKFEVLKDEPGTYLVDINGERAYFTIIEQKSHKGMPTVDPSLFAYIFAAVLVLATLIFGIFVHRRIHRSYYD